MTGGTESQTGTSAVSHRQQWQEATVSPGMERQEEGAMLRGPGGWRHLKEGGSEVRMLHRSWCRGEDTAAAKTIPEAERKG